MSARAQRSVSQKLRSRGLPAGLCLRLHHQELRGVLRPLLRLLAEAAEVLRQPRPADGAAAVGDAAPAGGHQAVPEDRKQLMEGESVWADFSYSVQKRL